MTNIRSCRVCGCTEIRACVSERGACWWVGPDLCSHCEHKVPAQPWGTVLKPWTNAGYTVNVVLSGGGIVCKIPPSTSRSEAQVMTLANRLAHVPVYEAALKALSVHSDPLVRLVATEALQKGLRE